MHRDQAIALLRRHADEARSAGVRALYLFGSTARNAAASDSDIDIYVDPDYERFGFVELIRLEDMLTQALGRKVELTTRDSLHPLLRSRIEAEAVPVF
jgi:hypothetical protein